MKCLFLRVRYPPARTMEDLVKKIFLLDIHSEKATSFIKRSKLGFNDYRNKYNNAILSLVNEYKKIRYSLCFLYLY
jgi:hypothetical protein